jgi:transcriptional regulator with PAS, ATPase and Fis domain
MRSMYQVLETIKDSTATVLITGETGTGKELIANSIHYNSPQKNSPMISVNCGAIPKELMQREFFGHIKGAFTGAIETKKGYFEEANGGTLFLDEIGSMDIDMQVKLLRALEGGKIVRVGDSVPTKVDVRLIAATNKDLLSEVRKGNFREDLYYRLYVIPIHIPPLRERREDIPLLIEYFMKYFQLESKKKIPLLSEEEMSLLMDYTYPGNIRELKHIVERFCLFDGTLELLFNEQSKLPRAKHVCLPLDNILSSDKPLETLSRRIQEAKKKSEKELIMNVLSNCNNNHSEAARMLNISRSSLYRKISKTS